MHDVTGSAVTSVNIVIRTIRIIGVCVCVRGLVNQHYLTTNSYEFDA